MKKFFCFFLLLILFLYVGETGQAKGQEEVLIGFRTKIEGYITEIDADNKLIFINGIKYQLATESSISLNEGSSSLQALQPPAPGFYKWGELYLDDANRVLKIDAYYKVVEGIIKEISHKDMSLILLEYRQDTSSEKGFQRYIVLEKKEEFNNLKENDHIILIIARDKILSIYY